MIALEIANGNAHAILEVFGDSTWPHALVPTTINYIKPSLGHNPISNKMHEAREIEALIDEES